MIRHIRHRYQEIRSYSFTKVQKFCTNKKMYVLSQFPYPSGQLHLGHARVYYIGDSLAKYYKMRAYDVLYPMGFDSFGLPAQNAAINHSINPGDWTKANIQSMRKQLKLLDIDFDWQCTFMTSESSYYKHTQKLFIQLFNKGLAYQGLGQVNWDPIDKTVLANEQVDINGRSWRSGALVQKKYLKQWYFGITKFAKTLHNGLNYLPNWIQKVKNMQQGWIGYRQGYFTKVSARYRQKQNGQQIKPEVIDLFMEDQNVLFAKDLVIKKKVSKQQLQKQNKDKVIFIINPVNQEQIAVQLVTETSTDYQVVSKDSIKFKSQNSSQNMEKLSKIKFEKGKIMKIRDWLISRQRYWGTPIPMIYCEKCGTLPVPDQLLPVLLPQWKYKGNPLLDDQFISCKCHKCKGPAKRQTDTMDTFVDSSWYYLRYLDYKNSEQYCNSAIINQMIPVDIYIGGMEHAIMHLLYARFVMHFIAQQHSLQQKQPFKQLIVQGLVKGKAIKLKQTGKYLKLSEVENYPPHQLEQTYEKMSKSKFNGINPSTIVEQYGSDALRIALFFAAPPEHDIDFNQDMLISASRFLERVLNFTGQLGNYSKSTNRQLQQQQLSQLYPNLYYNAKIILRKLQQSMEKRYMHAYVGNTMELFNQIKKQFDQCKQQSNKKAILLIFKDVFIPVLSVIAPVTTGKIKNISQFQYKDNQLIWLSSDTLSNKIQYLVMKGKKLLKKGQIQKQLLDEQIWKIVNKQVRHQLGSIKRNKKNIVIVVK